MLSTLPRPITAYVQAINTPDALALAATFAVDAVVSDDNHEYRGRPAIQAWNERNIREYAVSMVVTDIAERDGLTIVTARVSGTFDGSPLTFRYTFRCTVDEISGLRIEHIG